MIWFWKKEGPQRAPSSLAKSAFADALIALLTDLANGNIRRLAKTSNSPSQWLTINRWYASVQASIARDDKARVATKELDALLNILRIRAKNLKDIINTAERTGIFGDHKEKIEARLQDIIRALTNIGQVAQNERSRVTDPELAHLANPQEWTASWAKRLPSIFASEAPAIGSAAYRAKAEVDAWMKTRIAAASIPASVEKEHEALLRELNTPDSVLEAR